MSLLAELQEKNAEWIAKSPKPLAIVLTADQFSELFGEWQQANKDRNLASTTIERLWSVHNTLATWLDGESITIEVLRKFFQDVARRFSGNGAPLIRGKLSAFFEWLVVQGAIPLNPVKFAHLPQLRRIPRKRPYTHEEYIKLRDASTRLSERWLVVAAYNLGLRTSGVAWLKWKDVDMDARRICTIEPKVKRMGIQSVVPYVSWGDVEKCLSALHLERNDLDDSFPGVGFVCKQLALEFATTRRTPGRQFWRTCLRAGVEHLGPHSLRRAFCTNIANHSGLNHVAAMKMTGHKGFATYAQYVTVDDEVLADGLLKAFATVQSKSVAMKQLKAHNGG